MAKAMAEAASLGLLRRRRLVSAVWRYRYLYLLILPGIASYLLFEYVPMYGIVLAFKKYIVRLGIARSPWVGFANFASVGIQIGGIGALAPSRKHDLARLGLRAVLAGTLANFMSATIVGMLMELRLMS
jgi:ABC-type sugar transport system permease subunit